VRRDGVVAVVVYAVAAVGTVLAAMHLLRI
jgi:hypothetical protein